MLGGTVTARIQTEVRDYVIFCHKNTDLLISGLCVCFVQPAYRFGFSCDFLVVKCHTYVIIHLKYAINHTLYSPGLYSSISYYGDI
jgi:hypothetical protein